MQISSRLLWFARGKMELEQDMVCGGDWSRISGGMAVNHLASLGDAPD